MVTNRPKNWPASSRAPIYPGCGRLDQVQRVSAVYAAGRSTTQGLAETHGHYAHGVWKGDAPRSIGDTFRATTHSTEEHATLLSQALAPPVEPLYRNR